MTAEQESAMPPIPPPANHTRAVLLGSLVSGVAGYIFSILGVRIIGEAAFANVGVLWTVQYLVVSIALLNIEAWVTRHGGIARWVTHWLAVLTLGVLSMMVAFNGPLFHGQGWGWALMAAGVTLAYGLLILARGQLAANNDFTPFGLLNGGEAMIRLFLALGLVGLESPSWLWGAIMPIGPVVVVGWWLAVGGRFRQVEASFPAYYILNTTLSNAISQILLAGAPIIVALMGADPATTSLVFVTTTLGRAPLVFLHGGLLARMLPPLLRVAHSKDRQRIGAAMTKLLIGTALTLALAYVGGGLVGPPVVALAYGEALRPSFALAGFTGVAVVATMVALLLGQVMIALQAERDMALPWLLGLVATAIGALTLPMGLAETVVAAGGIGAIVAVIGLSVGVRQGAQRLPASGAV